MSQYLFSLAVTFLKQNFIAVLITGTLIVGIVIWKVSSWKTNVDNDRNSLKTGIEKLEKTVTDFMAEIRNKIDDIFLRLPPPTQLANSPIALSPLGAQVAEEIHVDQWVSEYVEKVQKRITLTPTPYEIQDVCFRYADEQLMEELATAAETNKAYSFIKADIEMSAYKNGIDLPSVLRVVGIKLRDQTLLNFNMEAPE